jgi:hypothetical protein
MVQILVPGYLGSGLGDYAVLMIVRYTTGLVYRISAGLVAKGLERQTTCKRHATRRREQRKMEWFLGDCLFRRQSMFNSLCSDDEPI